MQAKYQKEGEPDTDNFAPFKITMEEHMAKDRVKGHIVVQCVHAKYLLNNGKHTDPMLRMIFPNKEKRETKHVDKTLFPVWNEKIDCPIDMTRRDASFVDVEVLDHDLITKNDPLGSFLLDLDPCYAAPNTWAVNQVFVVNPPKARQSRPLLLLEDLRPGDCGKVYLVAKYIPEGQTEDQVPFKPADSSPEEDRKKEGLYGKMKFVVKSARDLANKDGWGSGVSDPYTVLILPDGQKKQTKVIDDNLNPDWNEVLEFDVKLDKTVSYTQSRCLNRSRCKLWIKITLAPTFVV